MRLPLLKQLKQLTAASALLLLSTLSSSQIRSPSYPAVNTSPFLSTSDAIEPYPPTPSLPLWTIAANQLIQSPAFNTLPLQQIQKEAYVRNVSPFRLEMDYSPNNNTCQLLWYPGSQWLPWFDNSSNSPSELHAIRQAIIAHELAHCWHRTPAAKTLDQWMRTQPPTPTATSPSPYPALQEAFSDLVALSWTAHNSPQHLRFVWLTLKKLRTNPLLDQSNHGNPWLYAASTWPILQNALTNNPLPLENAAQLLQQLPAFRVLP